VLLLIGYKGHAYYNEDFLSMCPLGNYRAHHEILLDYKNFFTAWMNMRIKNCIRSPLKEEVVEES
jgi:hypothetical protein